MCCSGGKRGNHYIQSACNDMRFSGWINPIHGISFGERFKFGQLRTEWQWEMPSATNCDPHVLTEDRRPLIRWYCDEVNVASATLTDNRVPMRSFDILYPIGILAQ